MILTDPQRKALDRSVTRAREIAEAAAAEALAELGVAERDRPAHLTDDQNAHRLELRAKARQLGDSTEARSAEIPLLTRDVAYEQWHRLLFARFLEQNGLLRHPTYPETALSLEDCAELAATEGEPDGWSLAARFSSEILPGIFRLADPAVQVRYPRERMLELEAVLAEIPLDAFRTEDALGWVYQFWQTAEKKRVNESGHKIGGADLSPVTQLFTENYMVRFLLENSLGAWWAARHPESPLVAEWDYLRLLEDGTPAAGTFAEWPATAAEVTVMDPCCGSGHFLVAAFGMLWRMRAEEEGLSDADAQDAVLRDNLFGLELDPRCTQLARFNVVLEAWKQGGFRRLPVPQIACSGIPVRATRDEWEAMASTEAERNNLVRLHSLFRNADTLGSLIDPRQGSGDALLTAEFLIDYGTQSQSALHALLDTETTGADALGQSVIDVRVTAALLSRRYTLTCMNPPYLSTLRFTSALSDYLERNHPEGKRELSLAFTLAWSRRTTSIATVGPSEWQFLGPYREYRRTALMRSGLRLVVRLGWDSFATSLRVNPSLTIATGVAAPTSSINFGSLAPTAYVAKPSALKGAVLTGIDTATILRDNDSIISPQPSSNAGDPLSEYCSARTGMSAGDAGRFERGFWETGLGADWEFLQSTVSSTVDYGGRSKIVLWENGSGAMARLAESVRDRNHAAQNWRRGMPSWGKRGVAVSLMGQLPTTLYSGDRYDLNCCAVVPHDPTDLGALWAFATSGEWARQIRAVDDSLKVAPGTLLRARFDRDHWNHVASAAGPLPEPHSDDPTQWLFKGEIPNATHPLQVAVARLLGYRWPDQVADALDAHADADGIAALVPLPHEPDAVTRLRALLSTAYGDAWSTDLERTLVTAEGGKTGRLDDWLRDTFFAQHVKVFDNRPFLWHLWDGHKVGGFSAIVNYHRLDHATLNKLTHTVLGAWIERQTEATNAGVTGADLRLAAAKNLRERLQLVLDGEAPYDTYVRWKEPHEQSIGWDPDLDDGVRLNIRPFIEAGLLRGKVNVHWKKDRGLNVDGTERHNDLHLTHAEKHAARRAHEATS